MTTRRMVEDACWLYERNPMSEQLTPEQAVRLLRAKAGELEQFVGDQGAVPMVMDVALAADIALVAQLLAEHIERVEVDP